MLKNRKILFALSLILWLFFSTIPWQTWLKWESFQFLLGISIYIFPGLLTFHLFSENKNFSLFSILCGFVIAICFTGLLGVLARLFELNFIFIRSIFVLWGVFLLCTYFFKKLTINFQFEKTTWWEKIILSITIGGVLFFASITNPPLIHDDAFTYNALLYYFQNATALNFDFPSSLSRLEIPRFWIAYWPLVEALISTFSGIDGLFITGTLLPPLLACFSSAAVYSLARTLGLSRMLAGIAVLAQGFSLMRLTRNNQPGDLFFQRLTEDKVVAAFVISIVLITLVIKYFDNPHNRKILLIGISALAMAFTHPVQFGMTCMVIGVFGLPFLLKKDMRLKYIFLIGVLTVIVLIPYLFRFGGGEYSQTLSFSLSDVSENDEFARLGIRRVDIIEGTSFYGISRYLTVGLPYEMSLIAVVLSLFYFWRNKTAHYILSTFLVLGFAMFPYTGWIVGMFTTPFQLWRLTWQTPFGIAIAFVFWFGFEAIQKIKPLSKLFGEWLTPLFYFSAYSLFIFGIIYIRPWTLSNIERSNMDVNGFYANYLSTAEQMNQIETEGRPIIIGGPDAVTNSIIPSLTMKFIPYVFRVETGGPQTQLWKSIVGDDVLVDERFSRLKENNIEYLLLKGQPDWVLELMENYPGHVTFLFRDQRFSLYKLDY